MKLELRVLLGVLSALWLACALPACGGGGSASDDAIDTQTGDAEADTGGGGDIGAPDVSDTAGLDTADTPDVTDAGPSDVPPTDVPPSDACEGDGCEQPETVDDIVDVPDIPVDVPPPCELECCADEDCDDGNACTMDYCSDDDTCEHEFDLCDDDNECTLDSCDPRSGCIHTTIEGCCPLTWVDDIGFEQNEQDSFSIVDLALNTRPDENPVDTPVIWRLADARARAGDHSLYFGIPARRTYDNRKRVASRAYTLPFELSAAVPSTLSFWLYMDVEEGAGVDTLNVAVEAGAELVPVWAKGDRTPQRDWYRVYIDMAAFQGQTVRIAFTFDSLDGSYNQFEGVYIDDIAIGEACNARECSLDGQCNDSVACTAEACQDSLCTYSFAGDCCLNGVDCLDGDACSIDLCDGANRLCYWVTDPDANCCNADADCADDDICTRDLCLSYRCSNPPSSEPGCCAIDEDCQTDDPCEVGTCGAGGACQFESICCQSDEDCADNDEECTVESCLPSGACVTSPSGSPGCCDNEIYIEDFQDGAAPDFIVTNSDTSVGWRVGGGNGTQSATLALYYGNTSSLTYETGSSANSGTVVTGPIYVPKAVEVSLTFRLYLDIEPGADHDTFEAELLVDNVALTLFQKDASTPLQTWHNIDVDLSGFGGREVRVRWAFDTVNGYGNDREGIYVDDFAVTSPCRLRSCRDANDCDDGFGSTTESCAETGRCQYELTQNFCEVDSQCDDGDICTYNRCDGGGCTFPVIDNCCHDDTECDDASLCTQDACNRSVNPPRCRYTTIPDCCMTTEDCNDGNPCTTDSCPGEGEFCLHDWQTDCCLTSLDCNDGDDCTLDRCIEAVCTHTWSCCATDEDCDDGDPVCTTDACIDDRCVFSPTGAEGCCSDISGFVGFDGMNPAGFTFANADPANVVGWNVVPDGPTSTLQGTAAPYLYFGDPNTYANYGSASINPSSTNRALSDYFYLPAGVEQFFSFNLWMNTEGCCDDLYVNLRWNNRSIRLYSRSSPPNRGQWVPLEFDISYAAGHPVQIEFVFEPDFSVFTGSSTYQWHGIFIDAIKFGGSCEPPACTTASDCSLGPCSLASCVNGGCMYEVPANCCQSTAECNDYNACTTDACSNEVCRHTYIGGDGCCETDAECEDGNGCTTNTCVSYRCVNELQPDCKPPLPYCEGFSLFGDIEAAGFSTWADAGDTTNWTVATGNPGAISGNTLRFLGTPEFTDFEHCVQTPLLDASAVDSVSTLRFETVFTDAQATEGGITLSARVSDDGGGSWSEVWSHPEGDGNLAPQRITVPLGTSLNATADARIAFCVSGASSTGMAVWSIDDLCVLDNGPPAFDPIGDREAAVDASTEIAISANDPDGDPLSIVLNSPLNFASLVDHGDGTATMTVTPEFLDRGSYRVVLTVGDGTFQTETRFQLRVVIPGEVILLDEWFTGSLDFGELGWEERVDDVPGDTNWWLTDNSTAYDDQVARFEDFPSQTNFDHKLVSPVFDATGLGRITIVWDDAFDWFAGTGILLEVLGSRDGGQTWASVWTHEASVDPEYPGGLTHVADASAVLGGASEARLALTMHGTDTFNINWWEVDRVHVVGVDVGAAPVWDPVPTMTAPIGSTSAFIISASDADGDELSFERGADTPEFVEIVPIDGQSAQLVIQPGIGQQGVYNFQLAVRDLYFRIPTPATLTVIIPGSPPVIDPIPMQRVAADTVARVLISGTDPDGQPLTYTAVPGTPGFATLVDHGDNTATLQLAPSLMDIGAYSLTVQVDDTTQYVDIPIEVEVTYPGGTAILVDDFRDGTPLPTLGWTSTITPQSPSAGWQLVQSPSSRVRFDSFPIVAGFEAELLAPLLDTRGFSSVSVRFRAAFDDFGSTTASPPVELALQYSADGASTWTTAWSHRETSGSLVEQNIWLPNLAGAAGVEKLYLRFLLSGGDSSAILNADLFEVIVAGE